MISLPIQQAIGKARLLEPFLVQLGWQLPPSSWPSRFGGNWYVMEFENIYREEAKERLKQGGMKGGKRKPIEKKEDKVPQNLRDLDKGEMTDTVRKQKSDKEKGENNMVKNIQK